VAVPAGGLTGRPPSQEEGGVAGGRGQRGLVAPAGGLTGRPPSQEEGGVAGGRGGWEKLRLMQGVEGVELEVGRGGPRHTENKYDKFKRRFFR
jgi:hypothetical protein